MKKINKPTPTKLRVSVETVRALDLTDPTTAVVGGQRAPWYTRGSQQDACCA